MDELMGALSDMQHEAEIVGEEVMKLKNFSPEEGRLELLNAINYIESLSGDIRLFFDELIEEGQSQLAFSVFKGTDPWSIFGENE